MNRTHNQTDTRERGATLVEMALVMPVLLLIIVGIMELGLAFRDVLGSTQAAREGVRIATFAGNDVAADCAVIEGLSPYLITYLDTLERVEIYHANTAGQQIPSQTNVYTFSSGDPADCDDWTKTVQWNSTTRQVRATLPLDIIGVRIRLEHSWVSQLPPFSGSFTIDETAIGRLEPESF